jgi:hypothetical protein
MATTTNFGWQTPDDTDLVKDGAAAIRTLGQSIDTSMMDLEGGTTGQILAKNSGTDMDFVFIDNDTGIITAYEAKTDNYTIASGDEYNIFSMNAATDKEFRIPTDATFNFAIGTEINFFWITGAGQPSIVAVTPGTTTSSQQVRLQQAQNYASPIVPRRLNLPLILGYGRRQARFLELLQNCHWLSSWLEVAVEATGGGGAGGMR